MLFTHFRSKLVKRMFKLRSPIVTALNDVLSFRFWNHLKAYCANYWSWTNIRYCLLIIFTACGDRKCICACTLGCYMLGDLLHGLLNIGEQDEFLKIFLRFQLYMALCETCETIKKISYAQVRFMCVCFLLH
jgi:hypothetical protein